MKHFNVVIVDDKSVQRQLGIVAKDFASAIAAAQRECSVTHDPVICQHVGNVDLIVQE